MNQSNMTMKNRSLIQLVAALTLTLGLALKAHAQTFTDANWYHDYYGPASEAFQVVSQGDYVYACGGFGSVSSNSGGAGGNNLARFNLRSETWEPMPGLASQANFIRCIWPDGDGNLWVGGDFSSIGGVTAGRVAKFDTKTNTWSALIDPSIVTDSRGPSSGGVYAICRSGDYVYIGGFVFNSSNPAERFIRRYNVVTRRWSTVGAGLNSNVRSLAVDDAGNVYAGGGFTASGGTAIDHLAMWNGSTWSEVGGGVDGTVRDMEFAPDGKLYIGGDFTSVNGSIAGMVACWNGSSWDLLGGGLAGGGAVNGIWGLAVDSAGRLYVGGDFDSLRVSGAPLNKVACWSGGQWRALGSGLSNSTTQIINGVTAIGQDVYFTGLFGIPGGGANDRRNFARFNPNMNFTGYVHGLKAPIETFTIGDVLWVATRFNSNSKRNFTIQLWSGGVWNPLSTGAGLGNDRLGWSFNNYRTLGDRLIFRVVISTQ